MSSFKTYVKLGVVVKLQQVGDFSIFGSKSSHVQSVILKIILGGAKFWVFFFFNFRLYNVPSGSSARSLTTSSKREFWDSCVWCLLNRLQKCVDVNTMISSNTTNGRGSSCKQLIL